jgi:hypothetical protein
VRVAQHQPERGQREAHSRERVPGRRMLVRHDESLATAEDVVLTRIG